MIDFGFSMEERKKIEDIRLKTRGVLVEYPGHLKKR
jgi:hypothetical protein